MPTTRHFVVAYGTPGRYVRFIVEELLREGVPIGMRAADHPVAVPHQGH